MNRALHLAGVVAFALVPGCGDDTTGTDSGMPDFSMQASTDMAVQDTGTDAGPSPGTAQLALADVSGTAYSPAAGGGETAHAFTHLLVANQAFPKFAGSPQYIDSGFSGSPGSVHGCTANRYDLLAGPIPNPDENVGAVTYAGYDNTNLLASTPATPAVFPPPMPTTINCQWGGTLAPFYGCIYGTSTDASAGVDGTGTSQVSFPALPPAAFGGAATCPAFTTSRLGGALCEQHPIRNDGTTTITENVQGGGSYGAQSNKMVPATGGLPNGVTIITVDGAAPANAADPLAGVVLDGSADLVIKWSCDGTATPGSGCPTGVAGLADLLALLATTSTNPRSQYAQTAQFGTAQCAEQLGSATATVTLTKAAQMRMLMGQATGTGSIFLALVRLKANPSATNGHFVFFTAGVGNFAFVNQ